MNIENAYDRIKFIIEAQETNKLLKDKYDLHKSPEVERAASRIQRRTGERVIQDPLSRIQNYLGEQQA